MKYAIEALFVFLFCGAIFLVFRKRWKKTVEIEVGKRIYFQMYYNVLIKWKEMNQAGKTVSQMLRNEGYSKVAVYGMKKIGWILCNDLMQAGIEVSYAIDREAENLAYNAFSDIPDVKLNLPSDDLEKVDLIIVTALQSYQEIKEGLEKRYSYKVISLEELIDTL